nr:aliphatic sulfonate ABC transporter substrate-binding protein [Corynebacterium mendelii]
MAASLTACGDSSDSAASDSTAASQGAGSEQAKDADTSKKEKIDVNFGYIPDLNGTALLAIAKDQGLWEKENINVDLKTFTNGPLQITALGTGDLDYGYIGNGAFWLPAKGNADIASLIAISNADRLIAQPGITSVADLKGKKVGVPEGTSGDTILSLALAKEGMTVDDIQRIPMDPTAITSAFAAGQIDAAGIWYPLVETIKQRVPDLVELAEDSDFEDQMAFPSAIVMQKDLATKDPDKAARVERVLAQALDYRKENPDKTLELVADMSQQPVDKLKGEAVHINVLSSQDQVELWKDGTIEKWLTAMGDFFVEKGKVTKDELLPPAEYFQAELLEQAAN